MPDHWPPARWQRIDRLLRERFGAQLRTDRGSIRLYVRPGVSRPCALPKDKDVDELVQREIAKWVGLTPDEFVEAVRNA